MLVLGLVRLYIRLYGGLSRPNCRSWVNYDRFVGWCVVILLCTIGLMVILRFLKVQGYILSGPIYQIVERWITCLSAIALSKIVRYYFRGFSRVWQSLEEVAKYLRRIRWWAYLVFGLKVGILVWALYRRSLLYGRLACNPAIKGADEGRPLGEQLDNGDLNQRALDLILLQDPDPLPPVLPPTNPPGNRWRSNQKAALESIWCVRGTGLVALAINLLYIWFGK